MYGDEHPTTANSLDSLSTDLERNGKYLETLEAIDFELGIICKTYGKVHQNMQYFFVQKLNVWEIWVIS